MRYLLRSLMGTPVLFSFVVLSASSCSNDPPADGAGSGGPGTIDEGVTYQNAIRPLLEANCVSCHTAGGIGPFALDSWEGVQDVSDQVVQMVADRKMPPWMADPDCRRMQHERMLSDDEIQAFADWDANGRPEGDPASYSPLQLPDVAMPVGEPTMVVQASEAYTPNIDRPDDYRCLTLEQAFDQDTFVTGMNIRPEQRRLVHHVLLYLVPEGDLGDLEAADAAEEGPGYTCFGGPGVGSFETLGGWVPGSQPMQTPPGSALLIPAGSRVIMQIHFNLGNLAVGEQPPADRSSVELWTMPAGQYPDKLVNITLYANFGIDIPAGDQSSVHEMDFTVPAETELVGLAPHMHTLGDYIRVDLIRSGQETPECLVEIPHWDFNWQQFYSFLPDQLIHVNAGDTIRLRCEYDNSAANQPIVNGERLEPRDVRFGESTWDEMCLAYLVTTTHYYPGETGVCAGFQPCITDCPEGDSQCGLSCSFQAGQDCAFCVLQGLGDCAQAHCRQDVGPLYACAAGCDDYMGCLREDCAQEYDTIYDCIQPYVESGECDQSLTDCEVTFSQEGR